MLFDIWSRPPPGKLDLTEFESHQISLVGTSSRLKFIVNSTAFPEVESTNLLYLLPGRSNISAPGGVSRCDKPAVIGNNPSYFVNVLR